MTKKQVGRPREFDEDEAVAKITELFWEHGYEGTGLSDIMKATGLQKGSLYKAFGSKHEMYSRALAYYDKTQVDGAAAMLASDRPALERISLFIGAPIEAAWTKHDRRGCFLCNASADFAALDKDTAKQVRKSYAKLEKGLQIAVKDACPTWADKKAESVSSGLLSVYSGLRVMARASVPKDIMKGAKVAAMLWLDI